MQYSTTQVARMLKIAPSAIRYYEKEGIIHNISRNKSGWRYFTDKDIQDIQLICSLKKTGMSLKDIENCLSRCDERLCSAHDRLKIFITHRKHILNEIKELQECLVQVDKKISVLNSKIQNLSSKP